MNPLLALLARLHGGAGAPPGALGGGPPALGGGPPPSINVNPQAHPAVGGGVADALKAALSDIHSFVEQADDEQDKQVALQCYAKLQSILATEQKEKESALGVTPAHKMMAKATARGGY